MRLLEFKKHIETFPDHKVFEYSLSKPFSWRGSYDEVAFSITKETSTKEQVLENIQLAYTEVFVGYKGGEYTYNHYTNVNFEDDDGDYTDGGYTNNLIANITNEKLCISQEHRLATLAFR